MLFIYFEADYLKDYFLAIGSALDEGTDIDYLLCSPSAELPASARFCRLRHTHLPYTETDIVWTTVDLAEHLQGFHKVIVSMHHAGYDESLVIPNTNTLRYADYLFCSRSPQGSSLPMDTFKNLIQKPRAEKLDIVPIGYPKLDLTHRHVKNKQTDTSIIICFTQINDIAFNPSDTLNRCVNFLLDKTTLDIIIRPFPGEMESTIFDTCKLLSRTTKRVYFSQGSYLDVFASASAMIMIGRSNATTAFTFAYSTTRPVIWLDTQRDSRPQPLDIGWLISYEEDLLPLIQQSATNIEKLVASRSRNISFFNSSGERIRTVIEKILSDADHSIEDKLTYEITGTDFHTKKAIYSLKNLLVKKSKYEQPDPSYFYEDYISYYVNIGQDDVHHDCVTLLEEEIESIQPQVMLRIITAIAKRMTASNLFHDRLITLVHETIKRTDFPSEAFLTQLMRLSGYFSDRIFLNEITAHISKLSKTPKTLRKAAELAIAKELNTANQACQAYIESSGEWDFNRVLKISRKNPVALFGPGMTATIWIIYLQSKGITVASNIFSDQPCEGATSCHTWSAPTHLLITAAFDEIKHRIELTGVGGRYIVNARLR